MGLDIRVTVISAKDKSTVFNAYLRQRGTCFFDALPPEIWQYTQNIDATNIYELVQGDAERTAVIEILTAEQDKLDEYERFSYLLKLIIQMFPYDYIIRFDGC